LSIVKIFLYKIIYAGHSGAYIFFDVPSIYSRTHRLIGTVKYGTVISWGFVAEDIRQILKRSANLREKNHYTKEIVCPIFLPARNNVEKTQNASCKIKA
jgi:uncharacterized Rmd1/YagE family protein